MECTFARINQIAVLEKQNKNLNPPKNSFQSMYFRLFLKYKKYFLQIRKKEDEGKKA